MNPKKHFLKILLLVLATYLLGMNQGHGQIQTLCDEFNNTSSLSNWLNVNETENWQAEQLEVHDIDNSTTGHLHMMPYTSSWFSNYRGTLLYKNVDQNFIITTEVTVSNRAGNNIPSSDYSLAGIMIRTPRDYPTGALNDWQSLMENYIFLACGYASTNHPTCGGCPGPHFEVKSTTNGDSQLTVSSISTATNVLIRLARIDDVIIVLYQLPGQGWVVHQRYHRPDFPSEMQIGFVTYTDWNKVSAYDPFFHNSHVLNQNLSPDPVPNVPFNPDLIATFDFARFNDVVIPQNLTGVNLFTTATNTELLSFLGFESTPCMISSIEDHSIKEAWTISPNPTRQNVTLSIPAEFEEVEFSIFNLNGQLIHRVKTRNEKQSISLENILPGIYFCKLRNLKTQKISTQRLVIL